MIKALKNLKPIRKYAAFALAFVVLAQLTSLVLPLMMSMIINNGISAGDMQYIKNVGLLMGAVSLASVLISVFSSYFSSKTSNGYGRIMREKIFLKVESLSQGDIDKIGTPSLITRCTNDVKVLQDFILQGMGIIISAPIMLVGGTVMAFFLNAKLAMIIFAVIPIICIIALAVVKTVMPLFKKRQKMTDEVNRFLREKLSGIRVIRAFNTTEYEDERFGKKNIELSSLVLKFSRIMAVLLPICMVLIVLALDLLIFIATKNIDSMTDTVKIQNTVGDLQAFVIYMIMIIAAVTMSAAMFVIVPRANISARRINEVLELEPGIRDIDNPLVIDENHKGEVEFRNVSFSYQEAEQAVLSDISFTAESGKVTAIIGATGSGKTTLVNLISRFYDVSGGEVLFDGVDVRSLAQSDLHSRIGYVPQKAFLFSGTIKDNLRYGDNDADEEQLRLALEISQSSEFVDALPDGINSRVSQSGMNLSGGQKQRLSIARALTRSAEVYIFDDSFSALDFKTDAKLRAAIREKIDATVIIVAQRVGTIIDADKIIVLDEGKICGMGTHKELLESCEVYREIAESQLTKEALQ
ncbi:MAG: ABC transporter ATP-binding protein/permease [Ruminococcus sp.]|nr:ABC transporter ATP-binding protein/permease [Ruminococcus sp.]